MYGLEKYVEVKKQKEKLRKALRNLRMKCSSCGYWNCVSVNKIFVEQTSPKPKVKVLIPMYEPIEVTKCEKCGKVIAEP